MARPRSRWQGQQLFFIPCRPRPSSINKEKNSELAGVTRSIFSKSFRPWLLPSKPLPPIQISSPSSNNNKMDSVEGENKEAGTGYDNDSREYQEQSSEGKSSKWWGYEEGVTGTTFDPPHTQGSRPLSQAKETDHPTSPGLTRDRELRDGFGKPMMYFHCTQIRAALCMLAQKNLEQKDAELFKREMKNRRQRKTSLQPIPETVEPGDAAEATFSLPPVDGTASRVQRTHPGGALKKEVVRKQDNVPLLPNTPIIHGDGSFLHSSSVTSQTAPGAKRREEPLRGRGQKDRASSDPQQSLQEALSLLGSDDWELKEKGLFTIKHLAGSHSEVLLCRLRDICLALTSEVTNLRSKVSYSAIVTLGELFVTLKKDMDSEVDEVARVLLQMVSNSPEFVQKAASQTLGIMVENVTPARAMAALMDMGVNSRHAPVRKRAAELLLSLMQRIGATKLAGTARAERLAHVAGKLAQDCHKDTRHYGQEMVKMLLNHQQFKKLLEQSLSTRDLEDILTRIKKKGMANQKAEGPSVKEPVKERNGGPKKPQATLSSSKCWIFDYFILRISDSHKKVKQRALDVLAEITGVLKDALNPVIIGLVEGITKNLNSKDPRVRGAAVKALEESIAHLDQVSLLKEFSYQWNHLSGQALLDVTECITVVQRDALPVLWSFLENKALPVRSASVRTVATKLASALYKVMGTQLKKCAASKPPHVRENLSKMLGW
ncbi:TOG array regulator of axonemal microtubules protein 2-like [Agelaius phoeniceus]|uniref:TOG array regulator of axonemal microtubules protein 2-like n=1 Tax=Agelaius phoeniceus TaxID=39638 RepID=UPI00405535DC